MLQDQGTIQLNMYTLFQLEIDIFQLEIMNNFLDRIYKLSTVIFFG